MTQGKTRHRAASAPQGDGIEVPGAPARRAALGMIDAVLRKGLPLEAVQGNALRPLPNPADRALALAIVAEVLRRLPDLDALIDSATPRPLPDDSKARTVLRIALAQALRLGTPPHAAIATALPLVAGGPRRLVHGVFGTLMRSGATLPDLPALPPAVAIRWEAAWGAETAAAAARAIADPPPLDLCFAPDQPPPPLEGVSLLPGHLRLPRGEAVAGITGFGEGGWWVQDIAASMPARLLGPGAGRSVLDLCAAPGGKTMQLAAAGFNVTAVDSSATRLDRLRANLERTGLAAEIVQADLTRWSPAAPADAILLDAPCTATGIFRRHPDVLHRVLPRAIKELAEVQAAMLRRAADWLRPDGTLVYSVCSLEPQEGEVVARAFLADRPDYALAPIAGDELAPGMAPSPEGWLRMLPGLFADQGGADSFFIARFTRRGG